MGEGCLDPARELFLFRSAMRLVVWFIAISAVILVSWLLWGGSLEKSFSLEGSVAWLAKAGPWGWAAGIGLLTADLVLPVPGTVVMSALGYVYGVAIGGLVATVGLITGGVCGYGVGRLIGEKAARRWLGDLDFAFFEVVDGLPQPVTGVTRVDRGHAGSGDVTAELTVGGAARRIYLRLTRGAGSPVWLPAIVTVRR